MQAENYKVWIDYEQMGGSTLQAMAEAVENAAVVLLCMSEKYKQSPNCRTGRIVPVCAYAHAFACVCVCVFRSILFLVLICICSFFHIL